MGPLDYSIDVQSPFQSALQGFQAGNTMASMQAERQKQELANQAAQAAAERQKLVQQETAALFSNPNPTAKDFVRVASMLPEKEAASMRENWNTLKKESQDHSLQFAGQTMAAFNSGSPEVGISLLKEKAAAERNSGNEAQAKAYETWAQLAEKNPQAVMKSIGMMVAQVPGGDKVIESVTKIGGEQRAEEKRPFELGKLKSEAIIKEVEAKFAPEKLGLELGLTKAQIDQAKAAASASKASAAKSSADARRADAEAKQITSGVIPSEKRPEAEGKFRKEYSDQTKGYQEIKSAFGRIKASEDSAVGDLSLIFGYMKMLDPGSVVREGEFANAQNAAGVPDRVLNMYNKIAKGERLNESQRKAFKGQAEKLYKTAQTQENEVREGIGRIAKGYGLNTENIFYTPKDVAPQEPATPARKPIVVDY